MILELLKSLEEATDNLKKLFSKKESQALTNLLADCQDTAIQIGQFIEQLEGEGKVTVTYLEEYCDLLYHASEELNKPESGSGPIKKLQKQIVKIEESVKSDLKPDKIEVVFFPYKASMFDSLESIWLAAKDDPQCDAYVVPIPYYDKNPDGSFGQMHYEGGEYPDYVPVVDYKTYNVEEHHPDVIFIHNPYDEGNYVTSVHPDYYSKRLREFTECLVYVPYFVVAGDTLEDSLCVTAASNNAHKVIVQSEKIRDVYIAAYKKSGIGISKEKFAALGSPKFDTVINKKREDFKIPEEWAKIIAGKKVILYNTSLGAILKGDGKYLEKLHSVISQFKERDDVALWWRPHPLSKSTFSSMRSFLLSEYEQIVTEYKRGGFGIYDDTPDLHRAIAVSDAYYGDSSSLVPMYLVTGKPIMIQNIYVTDSNDLSYNNIYDDGDNYWAEAAWNVNSIILFKIDKNHSRSEYIGVLPKETVITQWLSEKIIAIGGNIDSLCKVNDEIDPDWFFIKDIGAIKTMRDCRYLEFAFMKLQHFLGHICSGENAAYKTAFHDRQMSLANQITENADGTCGANTYKYIKAEVLK
ncbi:MAG: CDP-glycerol glycerophosphotransferase family protein [Chitinispirillales bacterium]|jgi:hypothetical protein|nr:CDP-glycerol glycerophosphotransferase family protein [Chitinispirillales bacterium]